MAGKYLDGDAVLKELNLNNYEDAATMRSDMIRRVQAGEFDAAIPQCRRTYPGTAKDIEDLTLRINILESKLNEEFPMALACALHISLREYTQSATLVLTLGKIAMPTNL